MKALESAPERYDKGINWLGWGKLDVIRTRIADIIEKEGEKILEIGVGTGTQALLLAERGLQVIGIDHSPKMLAIARNKLNLKREEDDKGNEITSRIELLHKAAVELDEFPSNSFDAVTSTLVFSELDETEQKYVLTYAFRILKPGGALILADEVIPSEMIKRAVHVLINAPLKLITFLITQTTTKSVRDLDKKIKNAGFTIQRIEKFQLGSFQLVHANKPEDIDLNIDISRAMKFEPLSPPSGGLVSTFWQTATRMIRHQVEIGLIPVGKPAPDSPVLCTCNFKLTVCRLFSILRKQKIDAWILVAPTDGVNVWCASCGDNFNAGSVITAIKISSLEKHVSHRRIILPQLGASGIDPKKVKEMTGWQCVWGPVQMEDLPGFLVNLPDIIHNKTERQRSVRFGLKFRLEMAFAFVFPVIFFLAIPLSFVLYLLNSSIWLLPVLVTIIFHVIFIFLFWPVIPAHLGTHKVVIGTAVFLVLLSAGSWLITGYLGIHALIASSFQGFLAILNWWPLQILVLFLMVLMIYDVDGLTPTLRSSLGARNWNKGKMKMLERWGTTYPLTPYGKISANPEKCTGCGTCVDVCPMLIPAVEVTKKVVLRNPEKCVNCRACINRCPTGALFLTPETGAAKIALEKHQEMKKKGSPVALHERNDNRMNVRGNSARNNQ